MTKNYIRIKAFYNKFITLLFNRTSENGDIVERIFSSKINGIRLIKLFKR